MSLPSGGEKYRLMRSVGRGGMGVVYEAWDLRLDRRVALKFLHAQFTEGAENTARLEREARNAARVEHPNVVRVYGMETVDGQLVIEMQFIEGAPLHTILAAGKLAPNLAADLLRQFLEALAACHSHGVIHCDLKPGNLLVTPEGHLYLTDFGISHSVRGTGDDQGSVKEPQWGTPRYTPPEAWRWEKPDPRWDLYSAGAVFHEVLCGVPFRDVTTPQARLQSQRGENLPSIADRVPELSPEMVALIDGLTAHDPKKRPKDAQQALALLRETPEYKQRNTGGSDTFTALFENMDAAEQTTKYVSGGGASGRRLKRRALAAGAFVLMVLIAGLAIFLWDPAGTDRDGPGSAAVPVVLETQDTTAPPAAGASEPHGVPSTGPQPFDSNLVLCNSRAYFAYDDGVHGRELWSFQPDQEQMVLVADIVPGPGSSNPRSFLRREIDEFVFAASTPASGEELWLARMNYNGSAQDLRQIMDILPGPMSSEAFPLATLQTAVLFDARTLARGRELWCTNTAPAQTAMVADLVPGPLDSVPHRSRLSVDDHGAYMVAYGPDGMRLWRFDLETNTVRELATVDSDADTSSVGKNLLALNNRDLEHGMELWIYDPAKPGIRLLADIWPGAESSGPGEMFSWGKLGLFRARTAEHGEEPWCTDGTVEGTRQLMDIEPGPENGAPYGWVAAGAHVFFRAHDSAHGDELWMTDGTPEGTRIAVDIWKGPSSGNPYNIVAQGKYLYFSAKDGVHGEELWMLDIDDPANTVHLVDDLWPGPESSEPVNLKWWDDMNGIFVARTGPERTQLVRIRHRNGKPIFSPVPLPQVPQ